MDVGREKENEEEIGSTTAWLTKHGHNATKASKAVEESP